MPLHTIYLISGIIALGISLITYAVKGKLRILHCRLVTDVLWIICYLCQGAFAFTGAANSTVCLTRDYIFCHRAKGKPWASHIVWCVVFCIFFAITPFFVWTGPLCILTGVSSIISTIALFSKSVRRTRWLTILCMSVSLVYLASIGNIFSCLANICAIISAIIGLLRDRTASPANPA